MEKDWVTFLKKCDAEAVDLEHLPPQCVSAMPPPLLSLSSTLRGTLQKWSKVTDLSKVKNAEISLVLTRLLLDALTNIVIEDENAASDEDVVDKHLKILSFSLANCSKMAADIEVTTKSFGLTISLLQSAINFVEKRLQSVVKAERTRPQKPSLTSLSVPTSSIQDKPASKFITHVMQATAHMCIKYRVESSISREQLHKLASCLLHSIGDGDAPSSVNITIELMTPDQSLQLVNYCVDAAWALASRLDLINNTGKESAASANSCGEKAPKNVMENFSSNICKVLKARAIAACIYYNSVVDIPESPDGEGGQNLLHRKFPYVRIFESVRHWSLSPSIETSNILTYT